MIDSATDVLLGLLVLALLFWLRQKFRRPKKYYGQTAEVSPRAEDAAEPTLNQGEEGAESPPMTSGQRVYAITFLTVWLPFWTVACYFAFQEWSPLSFGDEGFIFLGIWLTFAIPGWLIAAWTLFRLLCGDNISLTFDGDADGGD